MPVQTDVLAEQIAKLASEIRESNRQFHDFRVEVAKELGAIRGDMQELQASTRFTMKVAAWGVGLLAPVVVSLVTFAVWAAWHAGKLDSRVATIEAKQAQAAAGTSKR